jgi:hypothetical protein
MWGIQEENHIPRTCRGVLKGTRYPISQLETNYTFCGFTRGTIIRRRQTSCLDYIPLMKETLEAEGKSLAGAWLVLLISRNQISHRQYQIYP